MSARKGDQADRAGVPEESEAGEYLDASIESVTRSSRTPSEFSVEDLLDDVPVVPGDEHIIFVPGFKGSELIDSKTGKLVWIHGRDVMPFSRPPPIALPFRFRTFAETLRDLDHSPNKSAATPPDHEHDHEHEHEHERDGSTHSGDCCGDAAGASSSSSPPLAPSSSLSSSGARHARPVAAKHETAALSTIDVVQDHDDIVAGGPLRTVAVGLYQVYGKFCARAERKWGARFHPFAYDWRRDNVETALRLTDTLCELCATGTVPRVTVIAHSMGGLITWGMLSFLARGYSAGALTDRQRALVALLCQSRIIFAGVPFQALNCIMEDFTPGTKMHSTYCPCDVLATFPSAWQLMLDGTEEVALRDPDWWEQRRIAMFAWKLSPERTKYYKDLVRTMQQRVVAFRREMLMPSFRNTPFEGLPVVVISSRTKNTPLPFPPGFYDVTKPISWMHGDLMGDGRIAQLNALSVPDGLDLCGNSLTSFEHGVLLNDEKALRRAFAKFSRPTDSVVPPSTAT